MAVGWVVYGSWVGGTTVGWAYDSWVSGMTVGGWCNCWAGCMTVGWVVQQLAG